MSTETIELSRSQQQVYDCLLWYGPMTDRELVAKIHLNTWQFYPQSPSGIRTRRNELVALDLVGDTGAPRYISGSIRPHTVWRTLCGPLI